ncbi:MAG: sigma-70 family RNA polymerase sigma factor [Firmicutes bacterium]|nr:sigma-70 family RNA polymerase sigma factor [[Eubacterium] siraeum]MCM1488447.1 sigma-70 family RNA polymerase sigma factor [Bacillota bacterium]
MDGKEIVELFFDRSEKAIAAASDKYGAYCGRIAMNILGSQEDSEECVNDAFLKAWELIPPNSPQKLSAFLGKLTRNIAINRLRQLHAEKRGGGEGTAVLEEISEFTPDKVSVENEAEKKELTAAINDFLKKLPQKKRNIFICRYWYCDSVKEIASAQGISENNVSVILNRTGKKLGQYLTEKGMI